MRTIPFKEPSRSQFNQSRSSDQRHHSSNKQAQPKLCTFSLTKRHEILVHSLDGFRSPEEDALRDALFKNNCFKLDDRKYIIPSRDLYESISQQVDESIAQFVPSMVFQSLRPMPTTLRIQIQHYVHYEEAERQMDINQVLPESFFSRLYEFQKEGIQFGVKNYGRLLIGDEMGVGKTIQALGIAYMFKEHWPLLIICPSLLMLNWKDEALRWLDKLKEDDIQVMMKQKDEVRSKVKIYITSYDLGVHHLEKFDKLKIAIADEAHHLKSHTAKRSQALVPFLRRMRHVVLLTGTPALAKPRELFNLLSIIRPDIFNSFKPFGNRYCDPKKSKYKQGMDYEGCSNPIELHTIISDSMMIRRLKKDVLDQLPAKIRQNIKVKVDKTLLKELVAIVSKNEASIDKVFGKGQGSHAPQDEQQQVMDELPATISLIQKCYKLTGLAKIDGICEYLEEIIDDSADEKIIIFAHHLEVLDKLEHLVEQHKWQYMRIDGSVSINERHQRVQNFQNNVNIKMALLSLTAASVGITLTAASIVVFAELNWTPGIMKQAEDRAHRMGQKSCVTCIYLLGERTLDDKIMDILDRKQNRVGYILDGSKLVQYDHEFSQTEVWGQRPDTRPFQVDQSEVITPAIAAKPKMNTIDQYFKSRASQLDSTVQMSQAGRMDEVLKFLEEIEEQNQDSQESQGGKNPPQQEEDIFSVIEEQIKSASKQR